MRIATVRTALGSRAALLIGEKLVDLGAARALYLREVEGLNWHDSFAVSAREGVSDLSTMLTTWSLSRERIEETRHLIGSVGTEALDIGVWSEAEVRLDAPVTRPGKIFGARSNYVDLLQEIAEKQGKSPPPMSNPQGFMKPRSALIGSGEEIVLPHFTEEVEHEIELAVIFGRRCRRVSEESAWSYIAGYTVANDISSRDVARADNGWVDRGKGMDTFCPMGPYFVSADEVKDPQNLDMELRINGEIRQRGNTRDMFFSIPKLIAFLSQSFTFEPGDILMTGTCKGVGRIDAGDQMEATIASIGTLVNPVVRSHV